MHGCGGARPARSEGTLPPTRRQQGWAYLQLRAAWWSTLRDSHGRGSSHQPQHPSTAGILSPLHAYAPFYLYAGAGAGWFDGKRASEQRASPDFVSRTLYDDDDEYDVVAAADGI